MKTESKTKTRNLIAMLLVAAVVAVPAVILACDGQGPGQGQGRGHGMHGKRGGGMQGGGELRILHMLPRLAERLGLSEDQVSQIEALAEQGLPPIQDLRDQMADAKEQFRSTLEPNVFDEAAVRAHAEAQAQLMVEIKVASMSLRTQAMSVLTPEQLTQLEEMRESRQSRSGQRGGRGGNW